MLSQALAWIFVQGQALLDICAGRLPGFLCAEPVDCLAVSCARCLPAGTVLMVQALACPMLSIVFHFGVVLMCGGVVVLGRVTPSNNPCTITPSLRKMEGAITYIQYGVWWVGCSETHCLREWSP